MATQGGYEGVTEMKNPAAVELGKLGGLKGGPARALKLSPEERQRIARKAASARWLGHQLLECPFCHCKELEMEEWDTGAFCVWCLNKKCGVMGPTAETKEEAIEKWNG